MKHTILFLVIIILFASCATTGTFNKGPFQKRKYNSGFYFNKKQNIQVQSNKENSTQEKSGIKEKQEVYSQTSITKKLKSIEIETDTVKIVLKSGESYIGLKIEDTETGVVIELESGRTIYLRKENIESIIVLNQSAVLPIKEEDSEKESSTNQDDYVSLPIENTSPTYANLVEAKNLYKKSGEHTLKSLLGLAVLIISGLFLFGGGSAGAMFFSIPVLIFIIAIAIAATVFLFYHYIKMFTYLDRTLEKITLHRKGNPVKPRGTNLLILTWLHLLLGSAFFGLMFWIPILIVLLHKYY